MVEHLLGFKPQGTPCRTCRQMFGSVPIRSPATLFSGLGEPGGLIDGAQVIDRRQVHEGLYDRKKQSALHVRCPQQVTSAPVRPG